MHVSAKCQWLKEVDFRAVHTVKHLPYRQTAGGSFIPVSSEMNLTHTRTLVHAHISLTLTF